jgi:hypothetical protein
MSCRIDYTKNTVSEIRDMVEQKKYGLPTYADQTIDETLVKLNAYRNIVKTQDIDNSKLVKGYHLDPSGKTARYVWVDTNTLAFKNRVTDTTKTKFAKKKGLSISNMITLLPDNIRKKELGTSLHKLSENIMNNLIYDSESLNINKNNIKSKIDIDKFISDDSYLKSYFVDNTGKLNGKYYDYLFGVKEIFDFSIEQQKLKSPEGKLTIFTEQFIPDWKKNTGGTIDLLIVYSDNTADIYDYKSVHVDNKENLDDLGNINNSNWLPDYKMEDFNTQIPILINMILKEGIVKVNRARIIPIHAQLNPKIDKASRKSGDYLSKIPKNIVIAKANEDFINPISLLPEDTGNELLNKSIEDSYILLNNLITRLEKLDPGSIKYNALKKRIGLLNKSISDIIIKKEFKSLEEQFKILIDRYTDNFGNIFDIDNKYINVNGQETYNYKYMSIEQIQDAINDVKVFLSISSTLPSFLSENTKINEEELNKVISRIQSYNARANSMLYHLQQKQLDRVLSTQEKEAMKDDTQIGLLSSLFNRFSELPNTVIQKANQLIKNSNDASRIKFKQFEQSLKKISGALDEWGQSQGLKNFEVYEKLINKKTFNLHAKLKPEFYVKLDEALAKQNDAYLNIIFKLKDNAKELFEKRKEDYKIKHNIEKEDDPELIKWLKYNSPEELKYTKNYWKYYEIDESKLKNTDYTSEYLFIKNNKPLLDYYNFWTNSMSKARNMYQLKNSYQRIPDNFVPWIKKSMIESFMNNKMFDTKSYADIVSEYLTINQEVTVEDNELYETVRGEIDPDTGKAKREIPKMFINPLRNASGEIDGSLKSFDLNHSLLSFMYGAINYDSMNKIEPIIDSLKDVIAMQKVNVVNHNNKLVKYANSKLNAVVFGESSPEVTLLEKMIDYHMYGIKIQENNKTSKFLLKAKKYQVLKELSLAPLSAMANILGAKTNTMIEGYKGYYYDKNMWIKANKDRFTAKEKYFGLAALFEPYSNKTNFNIADKHSKLKSGILKYLNYDTLLAGFRLGDEHIEENVMYSILQNYGIKDGKFVRIGKKTDIKSIVDSVEIKNDNLIIEGLVDEKGNVNTELYTEIRSTLLNIIAAQKGGMNDEDMNMINMHLAGNLAMSFKNWMPALINERFSKALAANPLKYNNVTNTITVSRYGALFSELGLNKEDKSLMDWFHGVFNISTAKLLSYVVNFGVLYKYDINKDRALIEFNEFKIKNRNNPKIQDYSFEDFLEYKEGQIKALALELRAFTILLTILALLGGDWDDDKEADYKATWVGRQTYKLFNRYRREMMSLINPNDWTSLFRSPLPITGLLIDGLKLSENTLDETRDLLTINSDKDYKGFIDWEIDKNDKTAILYYSHTWIPGYKLFDTVFEPYDTEKKKY